MAGKPRLPTPGVVLLLLLGAACTARAASYPILGSEHNVARAAFTILPPFWRTGWFAGLVGLVGVAAVLVGTMLFARRARSLAERRGIDETRRREALVFANIYDGVLLTDLEGRISDWNPGAERMFGYTKAEIVGKSPEVLNRPTEAAALTREIQARFRSGVRWSGELRFVRKDGTEGVCEAIVVPLVDEHGRRVGTVSVNRDVTARKQAEQALRENEKRFRMVTLAARDAIYDWDILADRSWRNKLYRDLFAPPESVSYDWWCDCLHPDDRARVVDSLKRTFADQGRHWSDEYRFRRADGEYVQVTDRAFILHDSDGRPIRLIGAMTDITERTRAEETLRASERRYRAIVEDQTELICRWLPGQRHTFVNDAYCHSFGRSREELLGHSFMPLIPEEDHEKVLQHLASLSLDNPVATIEHWVIAPDGELRWHQWTNRAIFAAQGHIVEYQSVGRDITARKRAAEALRRSEARFRSLVETTSDWVWEVDRNGVYTYASPKVKELLGYEPEEVGGKTPFDFMPAEEAERVGRLFRGVTGSGEPFAALENTNVHRDGRQVVLETSAVPILGADGNVLGYRGIDRDITERKRAAEALRESEERFRTVVDASKDAMIAIDHEGLVTLFNPAAEEMFGRKNEEIVGQSLDVLMPEEYRERHRQYVKGFFTPGESRGAIGEILELPALRRDGTVFPVELLLSAGRRAFEPFVLAMIRDITERKRAEEELRKFKTISDRASYGTAIADLEGHVLYVNRAFAAMHGYEPQELISKHLSVFHTEAQMPWVDQLNQLLAQEGSYNAEEVWHRHRDGSVFPTLMNAAVIPDEAGAPMFLSATVLDITEQKQVEELARKRQAELTRVSRLSTMGAMAAGLAHELNQPLAAIANYAKGSTRRIRSGTATLDDLVDPIEHIATQAARAGDIVRRTREFVSRQEPHRVPLDLNTLIREVAELVEYEARAREVRIRLDLSASLPRVTADRIQIQQVVVNLLLNAMDALSEAGMPRRAVSVHTVPRVPGEVEVAVRDNGPGIPPDVAERIFEPFFTTRAHGMGLGLAICRSIIADHGGRLWATPNPDSGTTFRFTLPRQTKDRTEPTRHAGDEEHEHAQ